MPLNLELKASVPTADAARTAARRCGARFQELLLQEDTYFRVPEGRLKLREIQGRDAELIYYRREENTGDRWSDYTRVRVADAGALKGLLADALGLRTVVRKRRELFMLDETRIHVDEVEGLGSFVEFEIPVDEEEKARRQLQWLRSQCGIADETVITTSYSDLILAKTGDLGA